MIFIMIPKKEILALCDVKKNPCHIKKNRSPCAAIQCPVMDGALLQST